MPRDLTAATPDPDREDTPSMDRPIPTPNQPDPRARSGTDSRLDSGADPVADADLDFRADSDRKQEEVSNVIPLPRTGADRGNHPGTELVPEEEIFDGELVARP